VEPIPDEFPKIDGAEIAATTYGRRVAGDFYDFFRRRKRSFALSEQNSLRGLTSTNPKP
jgi:hypothetical protein